MAANPGQPPQDYSLLGHRGPNTSFGGFERWKLAVARTKPSLLATARRTNRANLRKLSG